MNFITKGDKDSPQKKPKVFYTAHAEDFDKYFDVISELIFSKSDCTFFYENEPEKLENMDDFEFEITQMQLIVIPVTSKFLYQSGFAKDTVFNIAMKKHLPVLPILVETGLESEFNRICGNLQCLSMNQQDTTMISFDEKITKFLSNVLIGDELAEKVRNAFDAYIFLSYRKKDRQEAHKLMKLIHKNEFCRDIAIWYDEFLVPGEDFNNAIYDAMKKSKLFALAVTPNLLEKDNYVMTTEYPAALEGGIPVLPAEMVKTDSDKLKELFPQVPDCINPDDNGEFSAALKNSLFNIATNEINQNPEHLYFIALAYKNGIDVEVDYERAVKLLSQSAEGDFADAIEELANMYESGIGVEVDFKKALKYAEKLTVVREKIYNETDDWEDGMYLAAAYSKVGILYYTIADYEKALYYFNKALPMSEELDSETTFLYNNIALVYQGIGKYKEAIKQYQNIIKIEEETYGEDFLDTAVTYSNLGISYCDIGEFDKSLECYEKALKIYENNPSQNVLDAALAYNNIGLLFYNKGEYPKALEYYQKATGIYEKENIYEHPSVALTYNNIGMLYSAIADYEKAIEYSKKALEIQKKVFGDEHPDTAKSYNNIGLIYYCTGKYEEAFEYYEKALDIQIKILGETHAMTATFYNNLGLAVSKLGDDEKAIEYYKKSVDIYEKTVGHNHPETVKAYNNMGLSYSYIFKEDEAIKYFEIALAIQEDVLGYKHHDTALSYNNIGLMYHDMGDDEKALEYYEKASDIYNEINMGDHPGAGTVYSNIGIAHHINEDYEKAIEYYKKALEIQENVLGTEHPELAEIYNTIGMVYNTLCDYENALEYFNKALVIREKKMPDSSELSVSYGNVGFASSKLGNYEPAIYYCKKAISIQEKNSDPDLIDTQNILCNIYLEVEDYKSALKLYKKTLELSKEMYGPESGETAEIYNNIALTYNSMKKYRKAIKQLNTAIEIFKKNAERKSDVAVCYGNIGQVYYEANKKAEAIIWFEKAHNAYVEMYGEDDENAIETLEIIENIKMECE